VNDPVRQHWVPKAYLRGFATPETDAKDNAQVWVLNLPTSHTFCTSVNNIAVKKHLYTIDADDENPLYVVEHTLSVIEGYAKPLLEKLAKGIHLQGQDRSVFATFVSTLIMRNRRAINVHREFRDWIAAAMFDGKEDVIFSIGPTEHRWSREFAERFKSLDDEGMHVLFARSVITTAAPLAKEIAGMEWCLLKSQEKSIITSDNPVVIFHPSAKQWGIATLGAHIHLAISPEYMLLIGHNLPVAKDNTHEVPEAGIMDLNYLTMCQAGQFLICNRNFEFMEHLIKDFKGQSNSAETGS
jgi:hypothetical protein